MATKYLDGGEATLSLNVDLHFALGNWDVSGDSKEDIEKQVRERLESDAHGSLTALVKAAASYEVRNVKATVNESNVEDVED